MAASCPELHQVRLSFDPPLRPIPSSASGKVQFGEASLNCVSAASKRLSPSPPRPSTPLQCSLLSCPDLFVGNWTKASFSLFCPSCVRNNGHCNSALGWGIWSHGMWGGELSACFQVGLDLLEVTLAQIQKQVSPKPETYLWLVGKAISSRPRAPGTFGPTVLGTGMHCG